ncbi:MAG: PKD domain-containing protein [Bacteroidota bacterium]
MKQISLFILLLIATATQAVYGQTGCSSSACAATTLNISTGFNQSTSTYQTPLAIESNWTFIAAPPSAGITFPAPCWDIAPNGAWASFPNAKWVSPFQSNAYGTNNPAPQPTFDFQRCFCVCQNNNVRIRFDLLVDDGAIIYLDGNQIASAMLGYQFQWNRRLIFDSTFALTAGQHCLTVSLRNTGGVAMGFAVDGFITGANLLSPLCCNTTGSICGTKLNDSDCDGNVSPATDLGLSGWTIVLKDNLGNIIATQVTDNQGNYCFTGLTPGNYSVSEVNQAGWTQTFPSGSGVHNITLTSGSVATALFGNCQPIVIPPCDFKLGMDAKINNCGVNFTADISGLPAGYQVVSTSWTFGDGYSSTELNPTHFYSTTGGYVVCLKVTIFNGKECCTREICRDLKIEKACEGECKIDAEIGFSIDERNCIYNFSSNILYTGLPIGSWFWDFGDGTTGTGSNPSHQYATSGTYKVCLTLFASDRERCCFKTFCTEIKVECRERELKRTINTPTGKADIKTTNKIQSAITITDKNVIILNQNVPNPFAESTVIAYSIPAKFSKAQITFTNTDGKVIKTHDILEKGQGQLTVFANDLSTGVYVYTLVVDGTVIDSKRMVKQ